MSSFLHFLNISELLVPTASGEMDWVCEGEIGFGSSCTQRILIDAVNSIFIAIYLILLVVETVRNRISHGQTTQNGYFFIVSFLSAVVGMVYLGLFSWNVVFGRNQASITWVSSSSSIYLSIQAFVWILIVVSVNRRPTRCIRLLISVWWICFSLLISALDIKILVQDHGLPILEIASWLVNIMLLFCGIKQLYHLFHLRTSDNGISEPLLMKTEGSDGLERTRVSSINFISKLTFSWLNPLLRLGNLKPLNLNDIPELDSEDDVAFSYQTFFKAFEYRINHTAKKTNLAVIALGRCYMKEMFLVGVYALLKTLSVVASPTLLYGFIEFSNRKDRDISHGMILIGCLMVAKLVESLSQRHWFFNSRRFGMRMRSSMMAAVFQKLLKLSSVGRMKHSTGEIVNYIAVDAYRLGDFPWWFHMAWSLPLQMVLSMVVLFSVAGSGAIFSLVPLFICGILNIPIAKSIHNSQHHFMVAQDERLRVTSEILNNMKIIKLQSWEEHFRSMIESFRDAEFKWLKNTQIIKSNGTSLYWMSPTIVSSLVFCGCAVMGSAPLNATTIFTVLAILRTMSEPVRMLPEVLSTIIQVKVSLDRLDAFLLEKELENVNKNSQQSENIGSICIQNGDFSWDSDKMNLTLKGVDLEISRGQKIAVCGHVGSGKSSILSAILGEVTRISGSVDVHGSIAYVSQIAWIQSGTVRDNILFGKPIEKKRYKMAIKACALDKDIDNFDYGDMTEIGQRGLNMSGGQKQRIQLARAIYNDADIYLLDDPFSAVDAHTAAILFNDCVMGVLKEKTVILVTHQIEFLPEMDKILVMKNGDVTQLGTYEELLTSGATFEQLVNAHTSAMKTVDPVHCSIQEESLKTIKPTKQQSERGISPESISTVQLTKEEEKDMGYGGWKAYAEYIRISQGHFYLIGTILTQSGFVLLQILATYWLAIAVEIPHISADILVGIYAIISTLSCISVALRARLTAHLGLKASRAFFSGFMDSIFKAPMLFFDSTPLGRILTRGSSDMSIVDFDIPFAISFTMAVIIEVPGIIILMAIVTWPILIVAVPVMIAALYIQRYYLFSARELVRINGTTKAPLMNYAAETSLGVITIRAFDVTEQFIENNLKLINNDSAIFFHTVAALEWVLLRVETLQNVTIMITAILLVMLPENTVAPGFVGLSLSYAIPLTSSQVFFTRWYSNLDSYIISVERIKQYMHLPSEAQKGTIENMPSSWPSKGKIDFQDLKIRYRPNAPLVLKGITCTFGAGEKIGVVGRTGSGKTTLISCLFRLVEPAGGRILIDKVDICSIALKDLRMKLSIIPQEPTLFKGNVRKNMDPLGLHSDHEIWEALDKCQLKSTISGLPNLLDSYISDEGGNWSVGQRQLFCLGRVLLRRNKILVLDEATASIDSATDTVLQRIIRVEFASCTVVTVAHRVPTVMDSDKVMVLSYGNLMEYDKPSNLMEVNSDFSKLVREYWSNCRRKSS